jgi:hypothetical protein
MKIIQRDDKYYIQLIDGEIEVTPEEAKEKVKRLESLQQYCDAWLSSYGHNRWSIKDVPNDADTYLRLNMFFQESKKALQEVYDQEEDKVKFFDKFEAIFKTYIDDLKLKASNPYSNKEIIKYQVRGFKGLMNFIKMLKSTYPFSISGANELYSSSQKALIEVSFDDFLNKDGIKVLPYLIEEYKGASPQKISYMLFALRDMGLTVKNIFSNKSKLHRALESSFGKIGKLQAYNKWLNNLEKAKQNEEASIEAAKRVITKVLEQ